MEADENGHNQIENKEIKSKPEKEKTESEIEKKETETKKEILTVEEKEKIQIEKIELTNLKLKEKEDYNENKEKNEIEEIVPKFEKLIEKKNEETTKKEKIEEVEEKIQKLKDEEIKNIKLIPKQEFIIVVIHNITPNVTETHLKEIFSNYGEVKEVFIPINNETLLKKNYAFIEFTTKENAEKAQLYMDEGQIDGKVVRVEILSKKNCIEM